MKNFKQMDSKKEQTNKISRKNFLQTCGSIVAGGSILGISGVLIKDKYPCQTNTLEQSGKDTFLSPYKLVSSFNISEEINSFELFDDKLIVAIPEKVLIYNQSGLLVNSFTVQNNIRDIAVANNLIYLLYPTRIEVCDISGELKQTWEACSKLSDYCSFAVTPEYVFITDAANKNICKYTTEGNFIQFIQSPNGFIIPSYSFGITYIAGIIYCSNPGRHQVESYTTDGEYITSFGKPGGESGLFCGCCNPVYLTYTSTGEIITSEKGIPRISCYGRDGQFRSVLVDSQTLGGGNTAFEVKVLQDKLFIAGKKRISIFQYDNVLATKTTCSNCKVDCPLRKGITI